jgi:hypothetical protein
METKICYDEILGFSIVEAMKKNQVGALEAEVWSQELHR